jgi:hypothetical protein
MRQSAFTSVLTERQFEKKFPVVDTDANGRIKKILVISENI